MSGRGTSPAHQGGRRARPNIEVINNQKSPRSSPTSSHHSCVVLWGHKTPTEIRAIDGRFAVEMSYEGICLNMIEDCIKEAMSQRASHRQLAHKTSETDVLQAMPCADNDDDKQKNKEQPGETKNQSEQVHIFRFRVFPPLRE